MYNVEKFFSSTLWFSFGLVLNRIKYILLSVIVLRLGSTNLAIFYVSLYLINEFSSFAIRIVSSSYNRFLRDGAFIDKKENLKATVNSSLQLALLFGLAGAVLIFFLAEPIALLIKNNAFVQAIRLLALAVPFLIVKRQITQMLSVLTKYKEAVVLQYILETVIVLSFAYFTVFVLKTDIYTVLGWQVAAIILSCFAALILLYKTMPKFQISLRPFLMIPIQTSPIILSNALFIALLSQADILIVGFYLGATRLGNYIALLVAPHLIYTIATNSFGMFLHTATPFYQETKKVTLLAQKVLQYILILAVILTILIIIYPQEMLYSVIQIHTKIDPLALRLFTLAFFIRIIAWLAGQILIVAKKSRENMFINALVAIITLPLVILITPRYGFTGLGFVFLGVFLFETLTKTTLAYQAARIPFVSNKSLKILLIGVVFYILNTFVIQMDFRLFIPYFVFSFLLLLIVFGSLSVDDWFLFNKIFQRGRKIAKTTEEI